VVTKRKTAASSEQQVQSEQPEQTNTSFAWNKVGTSISIMWLYKYVDGALAPPEEANVKGRSFSEVSDIAVERIHADKGGLGIPNSFLYWHWAMVPVYGFLFLAAFFLTTPLNQGDEILGPAAFPWLTFVKKLFIFFNMWESLGLGVIHGPLHAKMSPPFQDWWYRLTPGTMKWNAPFMKPFNLPMKRNIVDIAVEGFLTYAAAAYALSQPQVTPTVMLPVMLCSLYEFIFDYGQHLHDYGTQNLHVFVCCCFPVGQGQLAGVQLFLSWFYFCSGICKMGPTFQYMFTGNLLTAKFMCDKPWSNLIRRTFYNGHDKGDYTLKPAAFWLATLAGCIEMLVPLLTWCSSTPELVHFSIFVFICMHTFIIATLIIDVFVWNFNDACWNVVLYGILHTGVDWTDFSNMHPLLTAYLTAHGLYVIYGHFYVDEVPYVVAHRHAAGNWAQGVLVIKKSAAAKLGKIVAHAGIPGQGPGWTGEWFAWWGFWGYVWNWNLPSKMLMPLTLDAMGDGAPKSGMFHADGDYILIHSVLFFDALVAHLRFDGLSNLDLVMELGRVCEFEKDECKLCWVGAFPSFITQLVGITPTATWKIVDSKTGVDKEGKITAADLTDPSWKKPSDLPQNLIDMVANGSKKTN